MLIPLSEPNNFCYIRNASASNHVHMRASLIEGTEEISTANTCKANEQIMAFFDGGAVGELEHYKQILEIHILLLKEGDVQRQAKEARLVQINRYHAVLIGMPSLQAGNRPGVRRPHFRTTLVLIFKM